MTLLEDFAKPPSPLHYSVYGLIVTLALLVAYRTVLHPLRSYPGPFAAKLTLGYPTWYAFQKRLHLAIYQNHQKYGSVFRIGPDRLVFNSANALKEIYQNERVTKSRAYLAATAGGPPNLFTALDNETHRKKRMLVGQVISDRAMRSFEPTMAAQIDIFLHQILSSTKTSEPVDITEKARNLSLDIAVHLAFGTDLNIQTDPTYRFILEGMQFGNYKGSIYMHYPILSKLYIEKVFNWILYQKRERYFRLLESLIKNRASLGKDGKTGDFYSYVADEMGVDPSAKNSPRGSPLWDEAWFFLTAGGDTVATAISACFFYLARNPLCYRRLAEEIRSAFSSAAEIKCGPQLAGCTYLRACIDEAVRMSPPSPTTLWRVQDPDDIAKHREALVIDDHVIPPGTTFGVNPYTIHHNEAYFPESFVYRPERWLDEQGNREGRKRALDAFAGFSIGSRACAGKAMAYLELSLVLAKVLWFFDFEAAKGGLGQVGGGTAGATDGRDHVDEYQVRDIFTSQHDGPFLVFKRRGDVWKELGSSDNAA